MTYCVKRERVKTDRKKEIKREREREKARDQRKLSQRDHAKDWNRTGRTKLVVLQQVVILHSEG